MNKTFKIKLLLVLPYLLIIFIVAILFKDVFVSMASGIICGFAYFGWILPEFKGGNDESNY